MSSFGAWLQRNRQLRGFELAEVAAATRLPERVLAALEADDLASLPDRAYAIHIVRNCATAIGLDPEDAALRLEEWMQAQPPATLPPPPAPQGPPPLRALRWLARAPARLSRDPWVWLVVAATAAACVAMLRHR